jgi:hypothetical protein
MVLGPYRRMRPEKWTCFRRLAGISLSQLRGKIIRASANFPDLTGILAITQATQGDAQSAAAHGQQPLRAGSCFLILTRIAEVGGRENPPNWLSIKARTRWLSGDLEGPVSAST